MLCNKAVTEEVRHFAGFISKRVKRTPAESVAKTIIFYKQNKKLCGNGRFWKTVGSDAIVFPFIIFRKY